MKPNALLGFFPFAFLFNSTKDDHKGHKKMKLDSYPPVFRTQDTVDPDEPNGSTRDIEPDPTPLLDFHCLDLDLLAGACKEWGLFRLANHGVPPALLTQLRDQARELFGLPFKTKQDLFAGPPVTYFWGTPALTPSGAAMSRGPRNVNWVEGFNVPLGETDRFCPDHPLLRRFRDLLKEYGIQMGRLGRAIFEGMAKSLLGLDMEQTRQCLSEGTGMLRIYRYPKCGITRETWGMDAHTDSSVLSIVSQDGVGGLEVVKDGKWHLVQPLPDALVVNLGDMMQAMSDDEYKSAEHRVKVNKFEERLSICYFVFPAPGCVIPSSKYRPFTYSDFQSQVQQDIKTLGTKVGLERLKIKII